jgi:hypothetical protein
MQQLSEVLKRMKSLIIVNLSNCINPFKRHNGLKYLIDGVISNKETLIEVQISGNHYNYDYLAVEGIKRMFFEFIHVKTLDISSLGLNKKDCIQVIGAFKQVNE